MGEKNKFYGFLLTVGLPVGLFVITYILFGFYYETNDDQLITLLLRGITIKPALTDLSLYFHGWSWLLAHLYVWVPAAPWYGILLYTGLLGATLLAFGLVRAAAASLIQPLHLLLVLILFYLGSWLEHVMWFNYMRVPFLLAGIAYLVLVEKISGKHHPLIYLSFGLIFLAALAIRPSAALLGVALVGPVFLLFSKSKTINLRFLRPMLLFACIAFVFLLYLRLTQTPAEREYQRLDWLKSTVIDFQIYQAQPVNPADSLGIQAIHNWLLADTKVIDQGFYERTGSFNPAYILQEVAPLKLAALGVILSRDQFLVLAFNGLLIFFLIRTSRPVTFSRQYLVGYQVYFWFIIISIGIFLKLPPRLITPALSLYTLVHLVLFLREMAAGNFKFNLPYALWVLTGLLLGLQVYKISHRAHLQQQQQQVHEAFLAEIKNSFEEKILVSAVFQDYLRSLSPFRNYDFGNNTVFLLTGWSTLDPGFKKYFYSLSGQPDYAATVLALAHNPTAVWLLPPGFNLFLTDYFNLFHRQPLLLQLWPHTLSKNYPLQVYQPIMSK